MNFEQIEGKWDQIKGAVRQQWAKLSDNDIEHAKGNRDKLAGIIKERYGIAKEEAMKQVKDWESRLKS